MLRIILWKAHTLTRIPHHHPQFNRLFQTSMNNVIIFHESRTASPDCVQTSLNMIGAQLPQYNIPNVWPDMNSEIIAITRQSSRSQPWSLVLFNPSLNPITCFHRRLAVTDSHTFFRLEFVQNLRRLRLRIGVAVNIFPLAIFFIQTRWKSHQPSAVCALSDTALTVCSLAHTQNLLYFGNLVIFFEGRGIETQCPAPCGWRL